MVICKNCGKDVEPVPAPNGKGPDRCPKCNVFIPTKDRKIVKAYKPDQDGIYHFKVGATTSLNSEQMKIMENLINIGVGESPNDVLKRGIYALATSYQTGGGNMQNPTQQKGPADPGKEMDEMQAREARDLTLERMKEKLKKGDSLNSGEIMEMVKSRQALKMLGDMDKDESGDFGIKDMMQLQMLQSFGQNQNNDGNQVLLQQIKDLQQQLSEQKQDAKFQEVLNRIESKMSQSKSGSEDMKTLKDFMLEIEKIRDKSKTELEKSKTEIQTEMERRKQLELDHKLQETERKIQEVAKQGQGKRGISKNDIDEIKETVKSAQDLARELGTQGEKKEKSAGELVTGVVEKTLENLTPIVKDYAEKKANQPQSSAYPPVEPIYTQPQQTNPGHVNPVPPQPATPEFVSSEPPPPTPVSTEEEMANMMHEQQNPSNKKQPQ